MAKFYTQDEACKALGMSADQLKQAVRDGKLREFRDGGKVTYKSDEVDRIAAEDAVAGNDQAKASLSGSLADLDNLSTAELTLDDTGSESPAKSDALDLQFAEDDDAPIKLSGTDGGTDAISLALDDSAASGAGGSTGGTDALMLEPDSGEDSGIRVGTGSGDAVSLDDTATSGEEDEKEGTVVSSIGVSVFDDDDVEQAADPLAQTVVSEGAEALGIDAAGSGSGLLDLTRESDDTSLGAELLDEIYPGGEGEMGEATRAGLEQAIPETGAGDSDALTPAAAEAPAAQTTVVSGAAARVTYAPDAWSTALTGTLAAGVLVMCLAGLATAAALQDVWPSLLDTVFSKLTIVAGAAFGLAAVATGVGYVLGKRGSG